MKKTIISAALGVSLLALSAGLARAEFTLDILHINDFHSRIEAINRFDSTCSGEDETEGKCFGGIARVKTKIDERRAALTGAGGNVLVLDAGDQFQGSLFYTTYKGKDAVEFTNGIGFDAMSVGNHEFDNGPEGLAAFLDEAKFAVLSGNTLAGASSPIAGRVPGYIVKELGGEKVGIVSVLATDTDVTSSPGPTILLVDEIRYLQGAVAEMQADGVNKIVLVSHVGLPRDKEIAAAVDGIDVIVGGQSHTLLSNVREGAADKYPVMVANPVGKNVPIVQAYAYSKYVGELRVVFDDAGEVVSAEGEPHLLDASVTPDAAFAVRVDELAAPIEVLKTMEVGLSTAAIEGSRDVCRATECSMGNLVADAMLDAARANGTQIVIQNGGGLRASIDEGAVTMGEVLTVLPFQNTLATFKLTGADVIAALENGVSEVADGSGRFPQVAGLTYVFDAAKPVGERISDVMVVAEDGTKAAIEPAATYGVATNNFMRNGGDGYAMFRDNGIDAYDFGPGLEQVVADYLAANNPYTPVADGRVMLAQAAAEAPAATEAPAAAVAEAVVTVPPTTLSAGALATSGPAVPAPETAAAAEEKAAEEKAAMEAKAAEEKAAMEKAAMEAKAAEEKAAMEKAAMEAKAAEEKAAMEKAAMEAKAAEEKAAMEKAAMEAKAVEAAVMVPLTTLSADALATSGPAVPAPETAAPAAAEAAPAAPAAAGASATAETGMAAKVGGEPYMIKAGDTYWNLAKTFYGDATMWPKIDEANPDYRARGLTIGAPLVVPAN